MPDLLTKVQIIATDETSAAYNSAKAGAAGFTAAIQANTGAMGSNVVAINSATAATNGLANATGRAARGEFMEAQHAIRGMGEELGVHMPRFVSTFIAHIGGVAPVMAAAFAPVAIIGLIEILAKIPDAIDKIILKFEGFGEAAQKAF